MKRLAIILSLAVIIGIIAIPFSYSYNISPKKSIEQGEFVPGELIIKLKPVANTDTSKAFAVSGIDDINKADKFSISRLASDKFSVKQTRKLTSLDATYHIVLDNEADLIEALEEYRNNPLVEYAEPNYIYHIFSTPNDPNFTQQWSLNITNASEAWDIETGNESIIIAIIDTGVEWDHTDLFANIWNNTDEILDNSIDDDSNGYVDDIRGWDFVNLIGTDFDNCTVTGDDCDVEDNNPMDYQGHGTHCSGIAAALSDNSIGVAGVCQNCTIMPLRAGWLDVSGEGFLSEYTISQAITYAANNGARIISMSFGHFSDSSTIRNAINYAYNNKSCVLIAAAGNENIVTKRYPAGYDNVIAVASTNSSDMKSNFSQYGSWTDIAAPGSLIFSTYPNNSYAYESGTSMAAPFVAGMAGLILSKNSTFSQDQVRTIIRSSIDDVSSSEYIGTGRVNLLKALVRNVSVVADLGTQLDNATVSEIISINGTANSTDFVNYSVYYGQGIYPSSWTLISYSNQTVSNSTLASWDTRYIPNNNYSIRLVVYDSENMTSEDRLILSTNNTGYIFNINSCSNLNITGGLYNMTSNVSSADTCMNITAHNITLDCNGFTINYSQSEIGYGINNSGGYDNVTIRNCKIVQGGNNPTSYAIYLISSNFSSITNNTINTSSSLSDGFYLDVSSHNTLSNNSITTSEQFSIGIEFNSNCTYNYVSNNSINTGFNSFGFSYGIRLNSGSNYNNLSYNDITTSANTSDGVEVVNSLYNRISYNRINTTYKNSNGAYLVSNSNYNNLTWNNISTHGNSSSCVYIDSGHGNNLFRNELVSHSINSSGIEMAGNATDNILTYCKFYVNQSYALYLANSTEEMPYGNMFYNCLLNGSSQPIGWGAGFDTSLLQYWNTTNTTGTRIYSNGTNIGGNYYTNFAGNGYSDTCIDSDADGFCDQAYDVTTYSNCTAGLDCGNNTDYLALSNKFNLMPVVENVTINCSDSLNRTNGTLSGSFAWYDYDNLTTSNSTKWYTKNSTGNWTEQTELENQTVIGSGNTTKHDIWVFSAGVFDGYHWTWSNSSNITITNSFPSQPVLLYPADGQNITNSTINFSWTSSLDNDNDTVEYTLYLNGEDVLYNTTNSTEQNLSDGEYEWYISAGDGEHFNESDIWNFILDSTPPIISHSVEPRIVMNNTNVTFSVNITDAHLNDTINITIDVPGSGQTNMTLTSGVPQKFLAGSVGRYNITFYSNDTFGNSANATSYFISELPMTFNVSVIGYNNSSMNSNVTIEYENSTVFSAATDGNLSQSMPNYTFNVSFESFSNKLKVKLRNVDLSLNNNRTMGFDNPAVTGFAVSYAVNNSYSFSDALVTISYNGTSVNENYISLYKCNDWNFTSRSCTGTWENVTSSATLNKTLNYFLLGVSSFSGFAVQQDPYCGDGSCNSTLGEDCYTCSVDCGACEILVGSSPPGGITTTTLDETNTTTTTTLDEYAGNETETTTTIIEDALRNDTLDTMDVTDSGDQGFQMDFLLPAVAILVIISGAAVGYMKFNSIKLSNIMESTLVQKAAFYKEFVFLDSRMNRMKSLGIETEKIEAEVMLAKRAIESEAFDSARAHIENAKSLMEAYAK